MYRAQSRPRKNPHLQVRVLWPVPKAAVHSECGPTDVRAWLGSNAGLSREHAQKNDASALVTRPPRRHTKTKYLVLKFVYAQCANSVDSVMGALS